MKILVDANVFIDVVFLRQGWLHSLAVVGMVENGLAEGYVAAHTSVVIWFVARRRLGELHARVRCLPRTFKVVALTESILRDAIGHAGPELEDNIQIVSAQTEGVDYIVTRNLRHFRSSSVPVVTPDDFVKIWQAQHPGDALRSN